MDNELSIDPCWDQQWEDLSDLPLLSPNDCPPAVPQVGVSTSNLISTISIRKRLLNQPTRQEQARSMMQVTWKVALQDSCGYCEPLEPPKATVFPTPLPLERLWLAPALLFRETFKLVSAHDQPTSWLPPSSGGWSPLPWSDHMLLHNKGDSKGLFRSAVLCLPPAPSAPQSHVLLGQTVLATTWIIGSGWCASNVPELCPPRWGESLHPDHPDQDSDSKIADSDVEELIRLAGSESDDSEHESKWEGEDVHPGARADKMHLPQVNCSQPGAQVDKVHLPQVNRSQPGAQVDKVHLPQVKCSQPGAQADKAHSSQGSCSQPGVHVDKVRLFPFNGAKPGCQASNAQSPDVDGTQLGDQVPGYRLQEPLPPRPIRFSPQCDPCKAASYHVKLLGAILSATLVAKAGQGATVQVHEAGVAKAGRGATAHVYKASVAKTDCGCNV